MKAADYVAIACGGTGGHLFPGLAIAEALRERNCGVALLISQKEVDQEAVKSAAGMDVIALPAVALQNGEWNGFISGSWESYQICKRAFKARRPNAVLAMGGFTSAPPILAGKRLGAAAFLHEANAIPGRANRWLSPMVDAAFVGYAMAGRRLHTQAVCHTGTPVRSLFKPIDPDSCKVSLGLRPGDPVLLITGGSQGASPVNELIARSIVIFAERLPRLQFIHLAGMNDVEALAAEYKVHGRRAVVRPFLTEMELALGAATVAVARAGASSISELAAMRVPSLLIPYPAAIDNHQFYNARALVETGAARMFDQSKLTPRRITNEVIELIGNESVRQQISSRLCQWHFPEAADQIACRILQAVRERAGLAARPVVDEPGLAPSIGCQDTPSKHSHEDEPQPLIRS